MQNSKRSGFVAILGRPNAGKSTLLNMILQQKVSITARKPQTTRHRIKGIHTENNIQTIYVDTPGLHRVHKKALNRQMNRTAWSAVENVDVILLLVDARGLHSEEVWILSCLQEKKIPIILVLNKIDKLDQHSDVLPFMATLAEQYPSVTVIPISAKHNDNIDALKQKISEYLPEVSEFEYAEDAATDRTQQFLVAEILREKIIRHLGQEVPYSSAIEIESFKYENDKAWIHALIWVEKEGQKAIVIGNKGEVLKRIATMARLDMEKLLDQKVVLKVWVKVKENWSDNERILLSLVYNNED